MLVCGTRLQNHFHLLKKNITLLEARDLEYSVENRKSKIINIRKFNISEGSCIFIPGKNGAGKSSLLGILGGFLPPTNGDIFWKGQKIKPLKDRLVSGFEGIEMVKQEPDLNPFLTVEDQLTKAAREFPGPKSKNLIRKTISDCHLRGLLNQKTGSLSGGEKRRLAIGIALMKNCSLLLLDEPFSDLDIENKSLFVRVLLGLKTERKISLCIVSHDGSDAFWLADEVWTMEKGKILERIKRENETFSPSPLQTAILLGLKNCFDKKLFPMVGNQNSNSWIQILPQNVNVERIGPCIGEGTLLTHFQKDEFWFTIWNVNGQTIEAKNLKDLNSLSQKQELFLKI